MFLPGFGNRPELLVGRAEQVADFEAALAAPPGHPGRASLYVGQRGMGKTALLLELATRASASGFVVAQVTASEQMLDEILQLIQLGGAEYVESGKKIKGFTAGALGFNVGLTFTDEVARNYGFRVKLSLLCDALAEHGRGVAILVDEVTASSAQMRELATTYQHLRGEEKNIVTAMAGLPTSISSVLNDNVLTFLNRAHKVHLGPVSLNETAAFYMQAFERAGKKITADVLDSAVRATRGYPYLLQLIGFYILRLAGGKAQITSDIVKLAVTNSKREMAEAVYEPSLRPLSRKDLAFLRAMAHDTGPSQIVDIRQRMGVSGATVQQYRKRLIAADIIAPVRRGEVTFTLPYLGEYLASGEILGPE